MKEGQFYLLVDRTECVLPHPGYEPKPEGPGSSGSGSVETDGVVYLKANRNWLSDGARFAAYFYGGSGSDVWMNMTADKETDVFKCGVPKGYTKVVFVRLNPGSSVNSWDEGVKWNQTGDLDVMKGKCFVLSYGSWDNGTWMSYPPGSIDNPEMSACRLIVKVSKSVDWYDKFIYAWDSNETALVGDWPGARMEYDGEDGDYYVYHYNFAKSLDGNSINYIINGGNDRGQTNDLSVKLNGATTTVTVKASDVKGNAPEPGPEPEPESASCKLVVKVSKSIDWYDKFIYAWDSNETALVGDWPGAKLDYDGEEGDYYVYHYNFDKSLNGSTINYVINGGNGSGQTNDLSVKLNGATTTVTVSASDVK